MKINSVDGDLVCNQQRVNGGGLDRYHRLENYVLVTVAIKDITQPGRVESSVESLTLETWKSHFFDFVSDDLEEAAADLADDLAVIEMLIDRYQRGLEVHPVVIGKKAELIDGYHRVTALNTLGRKETTAYQLL